jgi:outer membrane protein
VVRCVNRNRGKWCRQARAAVAVTCLTLLGAPLSHAQTAPASAPPPGETISVDAIATRWPQMNFYQRRVVLDQLIQVGELALAEKFLADLKPSTPEEALEAKALLGVLRKTQGRYAEAAETFRAVLVTTPGAARVRMLLAQTLFAQQEDDGARHHFELLLGGSGVPGDTVAQTYINAIDQRRRWSLTSYLTLAPSTNINQGTNTADIGNFNGLNGKLDERNVKKAGIGIAGGAQAGYRLPLTDTLDLVTSVGANARRYGDHRFNDLVASVSAGPRARFDWGTIGLYGIADRHWTADTVYGGSYGGQLATTVRLGTADILFSDLICSNRRFSTHWEQTDLTFQNGYACAVSSRLEHHLTSSSYATAISRVGRERTATEHLNNDSWTAGAGYFTELPFGLSVYNQALYTRTKYQGRYPTFDFARADGRWDLSAQFTKRDWQIFGLAPSVQYTYSVNKSTVNFLSYDAHAVNVTLTKKF